MSTTTTLAPAEQALHDSMAHLESALLTPVVSGELESWTQTVAESLKAFGPTWVNYVKSVLHPQYAQIAKVDPDLLPRVDQLVQEDRQLVADFTEFESRVAALASRAAQVRKHESKVADDQEGVEQAGLALILRIKKQQAVAATWLHEANYRDRGVGD